MCIFNKFKSAVKVYFSLSAAIFSCFSYSQDNQIPKINVSGIVKLDVIYDISSPNGDRINYTSIATPSPDEPQMRLHARESRLKIKASDGILGKEYIAIVEGDFYGGGTNSPTNSENISNSSSFRLRHAYLLYGSWLFGQTWSNYVDVKSFPETLDFSNDTGQAFIRQAQIRYQHKLDNFLISYSLENPETDIFIPEQYSNVQTIDPLFDFTTRVKYQPTWGHLSFQFVTRKHKIYSLSQQAEGTGYGFGASGRVQLSSEGLAKFHFSQGKGIGRYIQEVSGSAGIVLNSMENPEDKDAMLLLKAKGGYFSYQHTFNKTLRANLSTGFVDINYPSYLPQNSLTNNTQKLISLHTNAIWSISSRVELGIEYAKVKLKTVSGERSHLKRLQLSTKVRF